VQIAIGDPSAVRVSLRLVGNLDAIEQELDVARERDDSIARARLIPRALALPAAQPFRAEYLDELAYAYEQLGRFDEASTRCARLSTPGGTASRMIIQARGC
jgi:hypothetical protein